MGIKMAALGFPKHSRSAFGLLVATTRTLGAIVSEGDPTVTTDAPRGLQKAAWTTEAAAKFWIAHGVASVLAAEGLPYGQELRVLVLLLAMAPQGTIGTSAAVESLIGPLLRASAPAAEAIRTVIRACITLLSRTTRNSMGPMQLLLASFLRFQVAPAMRELAGGKEAASSAKQAAGRLDEAAADLEALALSIRSLRRRREARALVRPLLVEVLGSEAEAAPAADRIAATATENATSPASLGDLGHCGHLEAVPDVSGLIDIDWEAEVLPQQPAWARDTEPVDSDGAESDKSEGLAPADALRDAASLFQGVLEAAGAVRDEAQRAARLARQRAGSASGRAIGRAGADEQEHDIGRPFISPAQASSMTRNRLHRQFGRAAEFVSPRREAGAEGTGGPVRASIATYGGQPASKRG
jgi:hypothetical protein